jgi:hypothetical protein
MPSKSCQGCARADPGGGVEVTAIGYPRGYRCREERA